MKKIVLLLIITLLLASCATQKKESAIVKKETISVDNDKKIKNEIITQVDIYSKKTKVTFRDPKDIKQFKSELKKVNKDISSNTGSITYDQIVLKARLLDYLGDSGKALKLYEQNFTLNNNDKSLAYNHNMAKLYEKLGLYDESLKRYGFLIKYFNRSDYIKDVANIWKIRGNNDKYEKAIKIYNTVMKKNSKPNMKIQNVKVGKNGVLELN